MIQAQYTPEELQEIVKEARYHLGVTLYKSEINFDQAVSELETALREDPENTALLYHLGQAIRLQIERNKLRQAKDLLQRYLLGGAPIGHEDEVRRFLGYRKD